MKIRSFLVLFFTCLCLGFGLPSFVQKTMLVAGEGDATKSVPEVVVPANCVAFVGVWVGKWDYGNYGEMRLHAKEVGMNCVASGSYGENNSTNPWPFEGAEIKGDKLSWLCNPRRSGTCIFEYHGDTLWARYHDPSGGRNNGVFKKVVK